MGSVLAFSPPSHPHSLLLSVTLVHGPGRVGWSVQLSLPERQGCLLTLARRPIFTPDRSGLPPPPTRALQPGSAPRSAHTALLSLNPANICCAPTVSHIRASRPLRTSPPPPLPGRPGLSASQTAAAEAQAPAGAAGEKPPRLASTPASLAAQGNEGGGR